MSGTKTPGATGLVLVSHSAMLAAGVVELAAQMAPDVVLRGAGGTDDARLGTSFDVVERAVAAELDAGCSGVVLLADIGSARMIAEVVLESLEDPRVLLAPGAFVEGAVAGAVAAQTGGDITEVAAAVAAATRQVVQGLGAEPEAPQVTAPTPPPAQARAEVTVRNPQGLHARPAAQLAALAGSFDALVTIGGVDAASLLSLMGLGLAEGDTVALEASGPQATEALDAVRTAFQDGFGEL